MAYKRQTQEELWKRFCKLKRKIRKNNFSDIERDIQEFSFHDQRLFKKLGTDEFSFTKFLQNQVEDWFNFNKAKKVFEFYEEIQDIMQQLIQMDKEEYSKIDYALYYENKMGEIIQVTTDSLLDSWVKLSHGDQSLRLMSSEIKKIAQEYLNLDNKDNLASNLKNINFQAQNVTEEYNKYINFLTGNNDVLKTALLGLGSNTRGFLMEGFTDYQSYMQKMGTTMNIQQAWGSLMNARTNTTPWWVAGDIGLTQVKDLTGGDVRLSRFNTIEDTFNLLNNCLNPESKVNAQYLQNTINQAQPVVQNYFDSSAVATYWGSAFNDAVSSVFNAVFNSI